jgi:hypothetical protein
MAVTPGLQPHGNAAQLLPDRPRSAQHGTTNGTTARSLRRRAGWRRWRQVGRRRLSRIRGSCTRLVWSPGSRHAAAPGQRPFACARRAAGRKTVGASRTKALPRCPKLARRGRWHMGSVPMGSGRLLRRSLRPWAAQLVRAQHDRGVLGGDGLAHGPPAWAGRLRRSPVVFGSPSVHAAGYGPAKAW